MRWAVWLLAVGLLSGCGYSSRESEAVGQPKKLIRQTPILCFNRTDLDMAMGVMRNGTGSIAEHDAFFTVANDDDRTILQRAINDGKLVRIKYDTKRFTWCWQTEIITHVEIIQ